MHPYHTIFQPEKVHSSVWIAEGAIVVGDVMLQMDASVWFTAVLRGDTEYLSIGEGSNIQDGAVCHADPDYPLVIGNFVTIGHRAIVHGARIGNHTLIGMGAIILNGAQIGVNCIVGAGALVTQNKIFPDNSLILGSPAKVIRDVTAEEVASNQRSALEYIAKARAFKQSSKK